jgi:hypothetical protein
METKILDTFPVWAGYPFLTIFVFALVACLWACGVHILAAFLAPRVPYKHMPGYFSTAFLTVCAATASWMLFSRMFVRFHAVEVSADHIELVYCWPRPNLSIGAPSLQSASIHQYRDKGCRLEVFANEVHFASVDSDEIEVAKQIKNAVDMMVKK